MSVYVDTNTKSFAVDAAIARYLLVQKTANAGEVALAGAADTPIGSTCEDTFAAGDMTAVKLLSGAGTLPCIASEAIASGGDVFAAANGKVAGTGTVQVGVAIGSSGADGDQIEVLPL